MTLFDLVILALRTLAKNKLRSGLTVLGVVIGIAAVTTMVSIGQGATELIQNQFRNFGSNVIIVLPGSRDNGGYILPGIKRNFDIARADGRIPTGRAKLAVTLDDGAVQTYDVTIGD